MNRKKEKELARRKILCPLSRKGNKERLRTAKGRCLLLLLCIRSAHLDILGFRMGGGFYYRDIFTQVKTMQRKQNLASALGIQKENWG